nr:transposase [Nocardia terpenica]
MAMGHSPGAAIPAETVRVAWAANPQGTPAMWIRDRLDGLFLDSDFDEWYPVDGRLGLSPARLALVSVLQFAENLTDRQAALAVACRIDWKYALGLGIDDPGFDHTVLCEFRERMAEGDRADRLLAVMVDRLAAAGLVTARGRQRTDSTHVLAAVRTLSRLELVGETLRAALEELALVAPEWLAGIVTPEWGQRYDRPVRYDRLPRGADARRTWALTVGADGASLLQALAAPDAPQRLRKGTRVEVLRRVWIQQYWFDSAGRLRWRDAKKTKDRRTRRSSPRRSNSGAAGSPDPAEAQVPWSGLEIVSPHDPQARFCHHPGKARWIGYKVHQTETCDDDMPRVIVHVLTTPAPEQDVHALDPIHTALAARRLLPSEHLVDTGYITPQIIHHAATEHAVTIIGPVREDPGPVSIPASPRRTSSSTGRLAPSPARRESPAHPGSPPSPISAPDSRCCSGARTAANAPCDGSAPATSTTRADTYCFCRGPCNRSNPTPEPSRKPQRGNRNTRCAPDARPRSPRLCTPTAYAVAVTVASLEPMSSTSSPPPEPTSSASVNIRTVQNPSLPADSTNYAEHGPPKPPEITSSIRKPCQIQNSYLQPLCHAR